jgi:hypothetical protein
MKRIYLVTCSQPENWEYSAIKQIDEVDPDEIICISNTEVHIDGVWGKFLELLQPWLEDNNKFATLVTPHLDDVYIKSNIKTERSYAMVESVYKEFVNYPQLVFSYDRHYCSYMLRADESRARLLDTLISNDLLRDGYVTYHQPETKTYAMFNYYNQKPLKYEEENYSKNNIQHFITPIFYENSFVDIVAESSFFPNNFFLTEKTLRPIFHKKPFLVLGPQNYYKDYLTEFFKIELYDELFDYSFDRESDLQNRIDGLICNIKKIKNINLIDLNKFYCKLQPKLDYNRSVIQDIYNDVYKIVPKCLHNLLDKSYEYRIYGNHSSILNIIENHRNKNG